MEAFTRLNNALAMEGSGLGLALVKDIAIYHGTDLQLLKEENSVVCWQRWCFKLASDKSDEGINIINISTLIAVINLFIRIFVIKIILYTCFDRFTLYIC